MGKKVRTELNEDDRIALKMWVGAGKTEQRLARRAQVILYAAEGMSLKEIARKMGLSWQACLKWRKRFLADGIEGLRDLPRSGKPPMITPRRAGRSDGACLHDSR